MPIDGSPVQAWWEVMSNYFSPYDTNPLNINPLKEVVERFVDFDAVRKFESIQLFISATNVHTGRLHVFDLKTEWYQTFLDLSDLLMTAPPPGMDEDDDEANGSFGGYYSKN